MTTVYEQLREDEGFRTHAYRCSAGYLTIGYGRNIDPGPKHRGPGISRGEANILLLHDIQECETDLYSLFGEEVWAKIGKPRRDALVNMRFQLGPGGFRSFTRMIYHVMHFRWGYAATEALDSRWASQTPRRAQRVAEVLRTGVSGVGSGYGG